jgi:hypothetical protein
MFRLLSNVAASACLTLTALAFVAVPSRTALADDDGGGPTIGCFLCAVLCQYNSAADDCTGRCTGQGTSCPFWCGCSDVPPMCNECD